MQQTSRREAGRKMVAGRWAILLSRFVVTHPPTWDGRKPRRGHGASPLHFAVNTTDSNGIEIASFPPVDLRSPPIESIGDSIGRGSRNDMFAFRLRAQQAFIGVVAGVRVTKQSQEGRNRMSQAAPYGSWKSPITSDLIVSDSVCLGEIELDGEDVYWVEMRPGEGGRNVIVRRTPDGRTTDVTPSPFNARTRAHEYGGGAFAVSQGTVYFSNFTDQRLYRQGPDAQPRPITPEADLRYADGAIDKFRGRMICVCEDHTQTGR